MTNIVLIGPPGSGKTTLAHAICKRDARFSPVDTDEDIVNRVGMPIPHIFAQYGESYFRARETEAAEAAAQRQFTVIATGGGMVTTEKNMTLLKRTGVVFYLRCGIETLHARTREDNNRPLLTGTGTITDDNARKSRLQALLTAREPLYRRYSDYTVDTDMVDFKYALADLVLRLGGFESFGGFGSFGSFGSFGGMI